MKELVATLNAASEAYYQHDAQIMEDYQYDKLADELAALEAQTGVTLAGSPSVNVGYSVMSALEKVAHEQPLLSLDKTKDVEKLIAFAGEQKCLLSWKLDGLTVVASYENGELVQALTRGNGVVGEDITHNALVFRNIPRKVAHTGAFSVRGEAIITFADFERINSAIEDESDKYKNPRNLTSGSVRQLNSEVTAKRSVMYYAFSIIGGVETDSKQEQLNFLQAQGFAVVPYVVVTADDIAEQVAKFKDEVVGLPYATDGLVVTYDSIEYSRSLGQTSKFPHDSIAFKWADETAETTLTEVIWNTSRTGLINPVAVFEPVELEGSTVKQASLHNISIIEGLALGIGDRITVYKANMIIPQVADNLTRSATLKIPEHCSVCGAKTEVLNEKGVKTLFCPNSSCRAQLVRALAHYVSRDAANIEGLSEATLEKFVEVGFLNNYVDIYRLADYKDQIIAMEGFGEKSYTKLIAAIEKSRTIELASFINALGIRNFGEENAKELVENFDLEDLIKNSTDEAINMIDIIERLKLVEGIGEKFYEPIVRCFANPDNRVNLAEAIKKTHTMEERADFINKLDIKNSTGTNLSLKKSKQLAAEVDLIEALIDKDFAIDYYYKLIQVEGFGRERAVSVIMYFADYGNRELLAEVMPLLVFVMPKQGAKDGKFTGKTVVITGELHGYENRKQLQAYIEQQGGKVAGSVSKNTDYLINNDSASASSKNKKARELGIAIITEDEFNEL